ncbi:MAG: class I SAM-dependent methyltransferase [Candidatus Margulisbacteria bacterium]|nr:class I SAM-dependent methyltransferase [Candidatus Margulisiibacteriota bacterium]
MKKSTVDKQIKKLVQTNKKSTITEIDARIIDKQKRTIYNGEYQLIDVSKIDHKFLKLIKEFKEYLHNIKKMFDNYEINHKSIQHHIALLDQKKPEIFPILDKYFFRIFDITNSVVIEDNKLYRLYMQKSLLEYFVFAPLNYHIFTKPLGYAGDYQLMNLIYETYDKYMGDTLYDQLIHNYTGYIPISRSNIDRLGYLKQKIKEQKNNESAIKIASIACGPAREIIELIQDNELCANEYEFTLIDFEKKAMDYFMNEVNKIQKNKMKNIRFKFIPMDILNIIRGRLDNDFRDYNLIYSSGLFDYLKDKIAANLIKELFERLSSNGTLIIINANIDKSFHRAYYETLGEWNFFHRTEENMLAWLEPIKNSISKKYFELIPHKGYHFLNIKK